MSTLRIVEGHWLEFEGRRVAKLVDGLPPTLVYRLEETLEWLDEDLDEELDEELERLIRAMAEGGRPSLAARMARARMRLVAESPEPDGRAP